MKAGGKEEGKKREVRGEGRGKRKRRRREREGKDGRFRGNCGWGKLNRLSWDFFCVRKVWKGMGLLSTDNFFGKVGRFRS